MDVGEFFVRLMLAVCAAVFSAEIVLIILAAVYGSRGPVWPVALVVSAGGAGAVAGWKALDP